MTAHRAKSVVYKEDVCLLTVLSDRSQTPVQLLSSMLGVLAANEVGIHIAATSEASASLVTERTYPEPVLARVTAELGRFGEVVLERSRALVCLVGEELRQGTDTLGRVFHALAASGIKARMVSQSASEINVAFLVDNTEIEAAVRSLHALLTDDRPGTP